MTRKHFAAIASILAGDVADSAIDENLRIACGLATYLAETNPRFDVDWFMADSGFAPVNYVVAGGFGPVEVRPAQLVLSEEGFPFEEDTDATGYVLPGDGIEVD